MSLTCCDEHFATWPHLQAHVKTSGLHQGCRRCRSAFPNQTSFNQHMRDAAYHKHSAGLLQSPAVGGAIPNYSVHEMAKTQHVKHLEPATIFSSYKGITAALVKPVFRVACALRFQNPDVTNVIRLSCTSLDKEIVGAINEGALRLVPPDNTLQGLTDRRAKMAAKAERAMFAENTFLSRLREGGFQFMDERQQKAKIQLAIDNGDPPSCRLTPDVLFDSPTAIFGRTCRWIEYKNTFGFKSNPFVHTKNKTQYQRYATSLGEGLVVYKLGYERDLMLVPGVLICREAETLTCLESHRQA